MTLESLINHRQALRLSDAWARLPVRLLVAATLYAGAIVILFHSVLFAFQTHILFGISDGAGQIRDYWAGDVQKHSPFTFTHDYLDGAPQGRPLAPAIQVANLFQPAFVWGLHGVLGLVGAWNVFVFLGFLLTSVSAFAFLTWLGCNFGAALFGGYVIAFNPWEIERAFAGHAAFLHGWVYILLVALLISTRRRRTWLRGVLAGVGLAICFYMAAYDGLFASLIVVVFFAVELFRLSARPQRIRTVGLAATTFATSVVLLIPVIILYLNDKTTVSAQASHPVRELSTYGASPLAYLLPSKRNPLFGFMRGIHPADFTEQTLFYGYTTIALAIVGYAALRRRHAWWRESRRWWTAIFFATLIPVAFVFSLPREYQVGGAHIYMPSVVLGEFTTFWRVYARFGILVGLGLAVLASLTLTSLSRRGSWWHLAAPVALAIVACIEFLPGHVTAFSTVDKPPYSAWLARHPGGIVATYPPSLDQTPGMNLAASDYWYQKLDGHPRFAFFGSGTIDTYANAIRLLARYVTDPNTPSILATEGVRYVVLHDDVFRAEGQKPPKPDPRYFTFVARAGSTRIFTVHAPKVNLRQLVADNAVAIAEVEGLTSPAFSYGSGFNLPEQFHGSMRRWMINDGELHVTNEHSIVTEVSLQGLAFSNGAPRLLQVQDSRGHVLAEQTIPTYEVPLKLGPFRIPTGSFTLTLVAIPDASSLGANDPRRASVFLSPLNLQPIPTFPDTP